MKVDDKPPTEESPIAAVEPFRVVWEPSPEVEDFSDVAIWLAPPPNALAPDSIDSTFVATSSTSAFFSQKILHFDVESDADSNVDAVADVGVDVHVNVGSTLEVAKGADNDCYRTQKAFKNPY